MSGPPQGGFFIGAAMTEKLPWMAFAEGELGQKEVPGSGDNPRILEYRKIAGIDLDGDDGDVPWCKVFVNAAFKWCGIPIAPNAMALSIKGDPDFVKLDGPAYGAVVAFWRGKPKSGTGHIGFYLGESANGSRIYVLGGNQGDQVKKAFFPASSISFGLTGYYWPKSIPLPETGKVIVKDDGSPVASAV